MKIDGTLERRKPLPRGEYFRPKAQALLEGKTMRTILLLLGALALSSNAASQQKPRPQLRIVIDGISNDATKCGVSKSQIESIAALTLRNNGIHVANQSTNPFLYVQMTFLALPDRLCVIDTYVGVEGRASSYNAAFGAFKARKGSDTVLCRSQYVQTTLDAPAALTQTVEFLVKQCLGQLEY